MILLNNDCGDFKSKQDDWVTMWLVYLSLLALVGGSSLAGKCHGCRSGSPGSFGSWGREDALVRQEIRKNISFNIMPRECLCKYNLTGLYVDCFSEFFKTA